MPNHSASSSSLQLEHGGLRLFRIGFSWGGVTSRIMAYDSVPRASGDVGRNLVRLNVGLEDEADLIDDLGAALKGARA